MKILSIEQKKRRAQRFVALAIKEERLVRQKCEHCHRTGQAHHEDYDKPLSVRWLCPRHHKRVHLGLPLDFISQYDRIPIKVKPRSLVTLKELICNRI